MLRHDTAMLLLSACLVAACGADAETMGMPDAPLCERVDSIDALAAPASYEYVWSCTGGVAPSGVALPSDSVADDCSTGIWPDLDAAVDVCPTETAVMRTDPDSGLELPGADARTLPTTIAVNEAGTFLPPSQPESWSSSLRIVAWNMEYTARLDDQLETLTTHDKLSTADVYLLNEVDRCSTRNGTRRAARLLAEALQAQYVYGIEFVELNIDRDVGGDTGQAIVSRRPMSGAALTCHSSHFDWFASKDEARLGSRVVLHADVPVGDTFLRVYATHLESNDLFGDKRSVQAKELLDDAQSLACERPQIVAGDFNAPYCGAPELDVLRKAGFQDAIAMLGDTEPTHENGFRLDYVWTRGFRVVDGGVVRDLDASDHDAVWVDVELE